MGPWLCSHGNRLERRGVIVRDQASMGPWLCSHGNQRVRARNCEPRWLQWGRGCVATEIGYAANALGLPCGSALQWGRGCVATEMAQSYNDVLAAIGASMGPWLCSHGNG